MADGGSYFSFFRGNHAGINIRIDIFIFVKPITIKFSKQVHLVFGSTGFNGASPGNVITSRSRNKLERYFHYQSAYGS